MGLFDNPLGFLFGDEPEQGAIDRRMNREPEGQRWWESWEQTFGQGGPMDPLNVYPSARSALEMLMSRYFPAWGNSNMGWQAPLAPATGNRTGVQGNQQEQWVGKPAQVGGGGGMPGLLEMEKAPGGAWQAAGQFTDGGFNPSNKGIVDEFERNVPSQVTKLTGDAPVYDFKPGDLTPMSGSGGRNDMSYRIKNPGESGYDSVRDAVPSGFNNGAFQTAPVGNGYAMSPAPASGGAMNPGLLEPVTLSIDGKSFPVMTRYDRERNDLAFRYIAALTGMMDPWLQGGMELEQGRYGSPYQTQGSNGLVGDVLSSFGSGLGSGFGKGLGDYTGGKLFGSKK